MNTAGTKIRSLMRLFDASTAPVWAISPEGMLVYLSASTARWLGIDVETLLNRRAVAGSPLSDDPLDQLAAALSAPPGLLPRGIASLKVQPYFKAKPGSSHATSSAPPIAPLDVRFVRVGTRERAVTLAIGGTFSDRTVSLNSMSSNGVSSSALNQEFEDAAIIRQQLDTWRKHHTSVAALATIGSSPESRQFRSRLQVAASVRTHFGLFGPPGSAAESIARRIQIQNSLGEPFVIVDGALMDPELLDASIASAIDPLSDSDDALATAIIRDLDEMPIDAQRHLVQLVQLFGGRFRIIGLCSTKVKILTEPLSRDDESTVSLLAEPRHRVPEIIDDLVEIIGGLTITIPPLSIRIEDIPLIATAIIHARFAAKEGSAERISRAAMDVLVKYPWPKNFDELDAAIRQAIRTAPGDSITPEHLPLSVRSYHPRSTPASLKSLGQRKRQISLDEKMEAFEWDLIETALETAGGNRAEAARSLGITRSRLLRRIDVLKSINQVDHQAMPSDEK